MEYIGKSVFRENHPLVYALWAQLMIVFQDNTCQAYTHYWLHWSSRAFSSCGFFGMREHPGQFGGGLRGGPPPLLRCEIFFLTKLKWGFLRVSERAFFYFCGHSKRSKMAVKKKEHIPLPIWNAQIKPLSTLEIYCGKYSWNQTFWTIKKKQRQSCRCFSHFLWVERVLDRDISEHWERESHSYPQTFERERARITEERERERENQNQNRFFFFNYHAASICTGECWLVDIMFSSRHGAPRPSSSAVTNKLANSHSAKKLLSSMRQRDAVSIFDHLAL